MKPYKNTGEQKCAVSLRFLCRPLGAIQIIHSLHKIILMYYIHPRWFCLRLNNFYSHRLRPNQSIKGLSFFSCGYWDVSLLRVCPFALCIQTKVGHTTWVSPFGNPGVKGYWRLTRAYRSLSRPSSPLIAKASTKHPLLLFIHAWRECLRA